MIGSLGAATHKASRARLARIRNSRVLARYYHFTDLLERTSLIRLLRAPRRLDTLEARLSGLEARQHETVDEVWDRSRVRWRAAKPDGDLTWGKTITGHPFVSKVAEYGALGPTQNVVEVGPGYGRLLQACIERGDSFREYRGIDLSADNVAYLQQRFAQDNISFLSGDIETVDLGPSVDTVISSLTFKHLFPSFERALQNIARQLSPGALVIFDLIEGSSRHFEHDGVTYIRSYTRDEAHSILTSAGLELTAFDVVYHLPGLPRLLVVARRGGDKVKAQHATS